MKRLLIAVCLLSACQPSALEALDQALVLERKRQTLERLQATPVPVPTARATPGTGSGPGNQSPRLERLSARLITTRAPNDTVELLATASDPEGDSLEYNWASVYAGLSSDKGQQVVWYPGDQELRNTRNTITLSVSDKKGGSSTGSLNIQIEADGRLLLSENTADQPLLTAVQVSRDDQNQVRLRAQARDPAGGLLRYEWRVNRGQLSSTRTADTVWRGDGSSGAVRIELELTNSAGTGRTRSDFNFYVLPEGTLSGDFRNFQGPAAAAPAVSPAPSKGLAALPAQNLITLGGEDRDDLLTRIQLPDGRRTVLLRKSELNLAVPAFSQLHWDGQDTLYLLGHLSGAGPQLYSFALSTRQLQRLEPLPPEAEAQLSGLQVFQGVPLLGWALKGPRYQLRSFDGRRSYSLPSAAALSGALGMQGLLAYASREQKSVAFYQPESATSTDLLSLSLPFFTPPPLAWDPTGSQLAVFADNQLTVISAQGETRSLSLENPDIQRLLWSQDGQWLILVGSRQNGQYPLSVLPLQGGTPQPLAVTLPEFSGGVPMSVALP